VRQHRDALIRKFFLQNLLYITSLSLIPILIITIYLLINWIPNQQKFIRNTSYETLLLIQENISLLFNDSTKIMNIIESSSNANTIRQVLDNENEAEIDDYAQFVSSKQISTQMNAIANTRDYIDSIYVYIPNAKNRYLTNQMKIYSMDSPYDAKWLSICASDKRYDFFRREIPAIEGFTTSKDILTMVERNNKGYVVAININVNYFKRILHQSNYQNLLIIKYKSEVLLASKDTDIMETLFPNIINSPLFVNNESQGIISSGSDEYILLRTHTPLLGLDFLSITEKKELYKPLYKILHTIGLVFIACILICLAISFAYSTQLTKRIHEIVEMLKHADDKRYLESLQYPTHTVFGYISMNLIRTFLQNEYMRISLNEKRLQAKSLELSALQYQINPHFLSNTLQIIDFEVLKVLRTPSHINEMIEDLSEFLQYSLQNPEQDVPLEQEIKATKTYTRIMSHRYPNQIILHWEIDEKTLQLPIPKLILQPLIENSIKHGLQQTKGILKITIKSEVNSDETICLSVKDNGPGQTSEVIEQINESILHFKSFDESHIGLKNLIRRIHLRFGLGITYEVLSTPSQGFQFKITFPPRYYSS
jgi:two-component system sensor histidine kinase YesM